jgi:uncharacterized protein (DUF362 family)
MPSPTDQTVVVYRANDPAYPERAPFHPRERFPEYAWEELGTERNLAYEAVRGCLMAAGLDAALQGTADWNPLRDLMRPGDTVLLKPNMVHERHPREADGWRYVLTHGSVIRAVADYVWKAIGPGGRIILADAPQTDASFTTMVELLGLDAIRAFYETRGLRFEVIDLRREEWTTRGGVVVSRRPLPASPYGDIAFDLGPGSEFAGHVGEGRYYGADYDAGIVNRHHSGGRHEYLIAGCAIRCDVIFSLPKLKTHKKAGITASLKNLVGVNADKNWLPHHTEGKPGAGGDEHPNPDFKHRAERRVLPVFRRFSRSVPVVGPWMHRIARRAGRPVFGDTETVVRSGNWWGNDTVWRMCLDLNKIVLYGSPDGSFRPRRASTETALRADRRHLAGQGRGPMNPDPLPAGIAVFGVHPPSVDAASAYLMGFDPEKLPIVRQAFRCRQYPLSDHDWRTVVVRSNYPAWNRPLTDIAETFHFQPHFGWTGHIERVDHP